MSHHRSAMEKRDKNVTEQTIPGVLDRTGNAFYLSACGNPFGGPLIPPPPPPVRVCQAKPSMGGGGGKGRGGRDNKLFPPPPLPSPLPSHASSSSFPQIRFFLFLFPLHLARSVFFRQKTCLSLSSVLPLEGEKDLPTEYSLKYFCIRSLRIVN